MIRRILSIFLDIGVVPRYIFSSLVLIVVLVGCTTKNDTKPLAEDAVSVLEPSRESIDFKPSDLLDQDSVGLQVVRGTPSIEDSKSVSQISISFNQPMGALGELVVPLDFIKVSPQVNCTWEYLDANQLVCNLPETLPDSNGYSVTVKKGIQALSGAELAKDYVFTFTTEKWDTYGRPQIIDWKSPGEPIIAWSFTHPLRVGNLASYFESECGDVNVKEHVEKSREDEKGVVQKGFFGPKAYKHVLLTFKKSIGENQSCDIRLSEKAKSINGEEEGHSYRYGFQSFPKFYLKELNCNTTTKGTPKNPIQSYGRCNPDRNSLYLEFSVPVVENEFSRNVKTNFFKDTSSREEAFKRFFDSEKLSTDFNVDIPFGLKPRKEYELDLSSLKDRFGRGLDGSGLIKLRALDYKPDVDMPGSFGVLEKNGPWKVPISARNMDAADVVFDVKKTSKHANQAYQNLKNYRDCKEARQKLGYFKYETQVNLKGPINEMLVFPFDIKETLQNKNISFGHGLFLAHAKKLYGRPEGVFYSDSNFQESHLRRDCAGFLTVVTDPGILAKVGHFDTGVWVHSLATGLPVANAQVNMWYGQKQYGKAVTNKKGFVKLPGDIIYENQYHYSKELVFTASTSQDFSLLPFKVGSKGLWVGGFDGVYHKSLESKRNHIAHAISDRALYKPGEAGSIKVFVRHWEPRSFGIKHSDTKVKLVIEDSKSEILLKKNVSFSEFGTAHMNFKLPADAPLGSYRIRAQIKNWNQTIGTFQVQEFAPPSLKVSLEGKAKKATVNETVSLEAKASYYFGGGVADAQGQLHATFSEAAWRPKGGKWSKFHFDHDISLKLEGFELDRTRKTLRIKEGEAFKTDKDGMHAIAFELPEKDIRFNGRLRVDVDFEDGRGKTISNKITLDVFSADRLLGLHKDQWVYSKGETIKTYVVVLDTDENIQAGEVVEIDLIERKYLTARVKGAGNYYRHETRTEDTKVDSCTVETQSPSTYCEVKPPRGGQYYLVATTED